MFLFRWLWALVCGTLRSCVRCGGWYDYRRTGGKILLESWGPNGMLLGSEVGHETCHRCVGVWRDVDYVHHPDGTHPQVNSKPGALIVVME